MSKNNSFVEISNLTVGYRKYSSASKNLKTDLLLSPKKLFEKQLVKFALKDVNLELKSGEILGLIGRNGAGKSTLVKAISGILLPHEGYVVTHGRVGALIELTGGFNMDLTLQENVVMHYVMNGFSKKIAKGKVNEIVEWAGLDDYLHEPLHSLSSGMVARFAFSTQTSITPDILILDEILSVGDAEFQTKSRLKILDLIRQGSIVIIVSHSIQDLQALTKRTIWLENGSIKQDGLTENVCAAYLNSFMT